MDMLVALSNFNRKSLFLSSSCVLSCLLDGTQASFRNAAWAFFSCSRFFPLFAGPLVAYWKLLVTNLRDTRQLPIRCPCRRLPCRTGKYSFRPSRYCNSIPYIFCDDGKLESAPRYWCEKRRYFVVCSFLLLVRFYFFVRFTPTATLSAVFASFVDSLTRLFVLQH